MILLSIYFMHVTADQICYSVLCVFSYVAAGTDHPAPHRPQVGGPRKPPPHLPLTPCLQPVYSPPEETQPVEQPPEHPSASQQVTAKVNREVDCEVVEQQSVVSI
ncbi:unnamed protein product [Callosobruchus maculatus]|uniref:Uncharacterized protein n=1 Tax=Callosobruchus maculatus TaxID=64391 RepID=A0A653C716_CALMS|nr:unnamed protein product [Callosobruchus maculatus]